jgi:hypothetical protein
VNGDGRVDVVKARAGATRTTWLNDGDVDEATPTPWVASAAWRSRRSRVVAANGADAGVRSPI